MALVGCGGQSAATGSGGGAGTSTATGGSGGAAGGKGGGALPACAIATRPSDPAGSTISSLSGTCNTIDVTTNGVVAEQVGGTDAGIVLDSGATVTPAGGTIQDGDYDMIRWQNTGGEGLTYRTIRVFDGGTSIEWAFHQMNADYDGGFQNLKFDTTSTPTGSSMTYTYLCGIDVGIRDFDYTAAGDDLLLLFDTAGHYGSIDSVDTYRRTCAR
jgi:hypothetical protein